MIFDCGRVQLGRECYPGGNCVASELGREHTVGQIKMSVLFLCFVMAGFIRRITGCCYGFMDYISIII